LHFIPSGPNSFVNLPREGGVAYAAQESWVQNETIRVRHIIPLECRGPFVPRKISFLGVLSMKHDTKRVRHTFTLSDVVLASEQSSINVLWNATSPCSKLVIGLRSEKKDSPSGLLVSWSFDDGSYCIPLSFSGGQKVILFFSCVHHPSCFLGTDYACEGHILPCRNSSTRRCQ
jgi:hypothetical protein